MPTKLKSEQTTIIYFFTNKIQVHFRILFFFATTIVKINLISDRSPAEANKGAVLPQKGGGEQGGAAASSDAKLN